MWAAWSWWASLLLGPFGSLAIRPPHAVNTIQVSNCRPSLPPSSNRRRSPPLSTFVRCYRLLGSSPGSEAPPPLPWWTRCSGQMKGRCPLRPAPLLSSSTASNSSASARRRPCDGSSGEQRPLPRPAALVIKWFPLPGHRLYSSGAMQPT